MRRSVLTGFALCLALFIATARANAGLIVTFQPTVVVPVGGTAFIDVYIQSDTAGTPVELASAGFDFLLTPTYNNPLSPTPTLNFVDPQLQDQTDTLTDSYLNTRPDYVFTGNSLALLGGFGVKLGSSGPADYIGGDSTNDSSNVEVDGPRLLARLQVFAPTASNPMDGDIFRIDLQRSSYTTFVDADSNPISYEINPGVVPEPNSLLLASLAVPVAGWFVRRRLRAAKPS
jgi:hypothetical protein